MQMDKQKRQEELTALLRKAADVYYNTGSTIMSDKEYDALFDELSELEKETGIILPGSVTQNIGADPLSALAVTELKKVKHEPKMLSLAKTKSRSDIRNWLGNNEGCLSWKMDGLTVVLIFEDGKLKQAITRGNGEIGDDITHNAPFVHGIPREISNRNKIMIRGEAVIRYDDFEKIKATEEGQNYKNPRNLCSGTIRSLDPQLLKARPVHFYAFELVSGCTTGLFSENLDYITSLGFNTVYHMIVTADNIEDAINDFAGKIKDNPFPSDGLVLQYNDIEYGKSLGVTGHHPKSAIAFKWQDETEKTTLREIEWSASATGRLNPVAVFDPVELEGTTVSRASVHNCSIVEQLGLKIGDTITVYKANMIIPQIDKNLSFTPNYELSEIKCPVCGSEASIRISTDNDSETSVKVAYCPNNNCPAKFIGKLERFVCRDAMNIKGLSGTTLEKLIEKNYIHTIDDLFRLDQYPEIQEMDGFGKRSYEKMLQAIKSAASEATLPQVLYAMNIPNIGRTASRDICRRFNNPDSLPTLSKDDLCTINGIGDELAQSFVEWFRDKSNLETWKHAIQHVNVKTGSDTPAANNANIANKTFVITGSVNHYANRDELKAEIEKAGGKVSGSVSKNTNYLINNDSTSTSGKNKKAKELGIPIITEDEFIAMLNG